MMSIRSSSILTLVVFLCLLCGTSTAFAQEDTQEEEIRGARHVLREGRWALQFQVRGLFLDLKLSNFQGSLLSAKYHDSDETAIRFGMSLNSDIASENRLDEDLDRFETPSDTLLTRTGTEQLIDESNFGGSVSAQYLVYPSARQAIKVYMGGGPKITFARQWREISNTPAHGTDEPLLVERTHRTTSTDRSWFAGALGVLGAEWFFHPSMSLSAEYSATIGYVGSRTEHTHRSIHRRERTDGSLLSITSKVTNRQTLDRGGFRVNNAGVRLGLSLYF